MILLVVDTQRGCFNENLFAFETVKENIKCLIDEARKNGVEICYVQHDDGPGTDLSKGNHSYEVFDEFAPLPNEKRFEKNVNSAFHPMTGLSEYLKSKNEKDIITIGVCTDYCMDATVKCGFEQGFNIIIPAYANSTYDNPYFDKETAYKYFNEFIWPKRYAKAISVEEAIEMMKKSAKNTQTLFPMIEQIEFPGTKQTIARKILEGLRDWFEIDESREKYISDCANWIFLAAKEKNEYVGFLCLKETGKETVELAVMGVQKEFHRKGLGRQLFASAKKIAIEKGYSFMQVKTVQMGVYPDYDITNRFYLSCGFKELEVIKEIWGEENPCQIYVMSLK